MISTQILLRYPFFGTLSEAQLREVARISEEVSFEKGETIFVECQPAEAFYLLMDGSVLPPFRGNMVIRLYSQSFWMMQGCS